MTAGFPARQQGLSAPETNFIHSVILECFPLWRTELRWKSQVGTFVEIPMTAHSATPLRASWTAFWQFHSPNALVPVVGCLSCQWWWRQSTAVGFFSLENGDEREKILPGLSQFRPTGRQPDRTVGDSWTQKVTGLLLLWITFKALVLWWHDIYLFLLYSLNWFPTCVYVSFHDFAHDNMDAGLCSSSPVRFKTTV